MYCDRREPTESPSGSADLGHSATGRRATRHGDDQSSMPASGLPAGTGPDLAWVGVASLLVGVAVWYAVTRS
jgi:hypothetical protein